MNVSTQVNYIFLVLKPNEIYTQKKKCLPDTRKKDKIFVYRVERSLMDSICKQNI